MALFSKNLGYRGYDIDVYNGIGASTCFNLPRNWRLKVTFSDCKALLEKDGNLWIENKEGKLLRQLTFNGK